METTPLDALAPWLPASLRAAGARTWRDVAHVVRTMRGAKGLPYELRSGRQGAAGAPAPKGIVTRSVRVTAAELVTRDAIAITFETKDGAPLGAEAGQFMTVHWPSEGRTEKRAYSLACAVDGGSRGRLVVKAVEGGLVSNALVARAGKLASLELTGPSGSFTLDVGARDHVLIAGGSGITPVASMLLTHVPARSGDRFTLVYGSRTPADAILREELLALAAAHPERLRIVWAFEREAEAFSGGKAHAGRLDAAALAKLVKPSAKERAESVYYVCGPAPMMSAAEALLAEAGVPGARVRTERFSSPGRDKSGAAAGKKTVALRVRMAGKSLDVLGSTDQTLLDAGLAAGFPMPYSCAMGGCGACKVRVIAGETVMEEPNCLGPAEQAEGYILACCTRPKGDVSVEVP
jgi:ring-1,2-phenylacetyl-CoA epoxidase subunit PaaE